MYNMKDTFNIILLVSLIYGAFGADKDEIKSVMEGDSVTLNPELSQIQTIFLIVWRFKAKVIAQISDNKISYPTQTEISRDRLELNQTGSLIIKNMRTKHSGFYELQISHSGGTSYQNFSISVYESPSVTGVGEAEMKIVSVTEGDPVTLPVPQIHGDELIVWRFSNEGKLIAKHDLEAKSPLLYNTDERYRDRLQLNDQTGSLTITNTRTTDSGLYTVKISSSKQTLYKRFTVTVSDPGVSPGAPAGIVVVVVLLVAAAAAAAAAAGVFYYRRKIKTKLPSETLSKCPGDNVTLNPDTEIQTGDEIQWRFGAEDTVIAENKKERDDEMTYDGPGKIFKNKLKLDEDGSLTIKSINTEHTGLYTLKIRRGRKTLKKKFQVAVYVKCEAVNVGGSVHLFTGLTEIQTDDEIQWLFKEKNQVFLIAEIKGGSKKTYNGPDEISKDSLKLDTQTGDLIIKNSTLQHAGCYKLMIHSSKGDTNRTYFVIIRGDSVKMNRKLVREETDDEDPYVNVNEKETGRRVNESATVVMPLLNGEDLTDDQEGTSSL